MASSRVGFCQPSMRFGFVWAKRCGFREITQRVRVFMGGQSGPRQSESGGVQKPGRPDIGWIEFVRSAQGRIRLVFLTLLEQNGAIERVQLKNVGPSLDGLGDRLARFLKSIEFVVGERQVVLHL